MNQMKRKVDISVVTPVYGCASSLKQLYERLLKTLSEISDDFEIIMVDDNSPDDAWEAICALSGKDRRVRGIKLSRNFGQHHAITAGLDFVQGEWTVVMDCDLQDRPEEIKKLYAKAREGYDIVVGKRVKRKDSLLKKAGSYLFYKVYNYLTGSDANREIGNFGIYSKRVIESVKRLREQNRSFGLFVIWSGFSRIEIVIEHAERESGKSTYTLSKLINLAIDSIVAHSNRPLKLSVQIGFLLSFVSLLYAVWLVISYLFFASPLTGWTSLIVSLYFLSGLIIGSIGMLGLYVGKIFDEVKGRPLYIIEETTFEETSRG